LSRCARGGARRRRPSGRRTVRPRADIARSELAYFTGRASEAVELAGQHLASEELGIRLSACLICAYANLTLGRIERARSVLEMARGALAQASLADPRLRAAEGFVAQTASVLLHLPAPADAPDAGEVMLLLPPGLRAFALYVRAHAAYLSGDYAHSLGIAERASRHGCGLSHPVHLPAPRCRHGPRVPAPMTRRTPGS